MLYDLESYTTLLYSSSTLIPKKFVNWYYIRLISYLSMSQKPLSDRIKEAREHLGLSQAGAAELWDINVRTLQTWEQGTRSPQGLALRELERLLEDAMKTQGRD